jgi:hypothetical protein
MTTTISTNFLPANLKVGTGFDFILDDYNKVAVNLEFNKLLVPTPQNPETETEQLLLKKEDKI